MKITPEYIRGFVDGEGSFSIGIRKIHIRGLSRGRPRKVLPPAEFGITLPKKEANPHDNYQVFGIFAIGQTKDIGKEVLEEIRRILGCGEICSCRPRNPRHSTFHKLQVQGIIDHVNRLIPFFDAHPPIIKDMTYRIWKQAVKIIQSQEHLKREGFLKIASLKEQLEELQANKGSSRGGKWTALLDNQAPETNQLVSF